MYQLTNHDVIIRLADNASIPMYGGNRDYQEYLEWEAEGNTPQPADVPVAVIPSTVSMRQARLALLDQELLDDVEIALTAQGQAALIEWEYATEVRRDSPLVVAITTILALTSIQIDELFVLANSK